MKQRPMNGFTLWFTGLPCSGKTTLSGIIEQELRLFMPAVEHLDGDVIRQGLSRDLGFSKEDRTMNIERTAFVASLLTRSGVAVLVSFVSPYRQMRDKARALITPFIEVYVRCSLEECERRDVKGMYQLARKGKISDFTGVSDPYEEPLNPEVVVDTETFDTASCASKVLDYLESRNLITRNPFKGNELLTKAFDLAYQHHLGQKRKGGLPYITHPVSVAKMLKEAGYGDNVLAAGLLHDVLEDTGCEVEEMEKAVGAKITRVVIEVTDKDKTVPWRKRKENYLEMLNAASPEALAVSCADKVHNVESLIEGYRTGGTSFSRMFSGGFEAKIENYQRIYNIISGKAPDCKLLPRYKCCLEEITNLSTAARL